VVGPPTIVRGVFHSIIRLACAFDHPAANMRRLIKT
jgi:hypothetical protein